MQGQDGWVLGPIEHRVLVTTLSRNVIFCQHHCTFCLQTVAFWKDFSSRTERPAHLWHHSNVIIDIFPVLLPTGPFVA